MKRLLVVLLLCIATGGLMAGQSEDAVNAGNMGDLRMHKRFGIGVTAGGPLSVLGILADVNLSPDVSLSGGIGTGLDYSTFTVEGKYYLLGDEVSPYFGLGFARWWTDGTDAKNLSPSVLANKFLTTSDYSKGFDVWLLYPSFGVQFLHSMGFSVFAEVQYLFKMFNFSSGTYAGLGVSWYF